MIKELDVTKLKAFQGSVLKNLKAPDTYRSYLATSKKVVKLYLRLHESQIFFPELVTSLKEVATVLKYLGATKFYDKVPDNLMSLLDEVIGFQVNRWIQFSKTTLKSLDEVEVVIEESREKAKGHHCSFCKVSLTRPSYIVHRNETEVLHKSLPIGIKCLRSQQGKLNTFLNIQQVASVLNEIKELV